MIKNRSGSIINTASMSGHIINEPQPQSAYNASKAGVIQLTKSLAAEWAPYNIRVNSISPGYIATEMTKKATQWIPLWEERTPFKRMGNPEELQGIVLYLASEASTYTTGSDFIIDGGFTCW
jgi:NAD(P)-dependent dehydrogenase (short-subunit alcohol dehydrogenase family)